MWDVVLGLLGLGSAGYLLVLGLVVGGVGCLVSALGGLGGLVFCHSNLSSTCGASASLSAGAWAVVLGLVWVGSAGYFLVLGWVVGGVGGLVSCH